MIKTRTNTSNLSERRHTSTLMACRDVYVAARQPQSPAPPPPLPLPCRPLPSPAVPLAVSAADSLRLAVTSLSQDRAALTTLTYSRILSRPSREARVIAASQWRPRGSLGAWRCQYTGTPLSMSRWTIHCLGRAARMGRSQWSLTFGTEKGMQGLDVEQRTLGLV